MNPEKVIKFDFENKLKEFNLCYTNKKRIEINKKMMDKQSNKIWRRI
jgi:hypothetical protein